MSMLISISGNGAGAGSLTLKRCCQLDYLPETLQPILKAQDIDKTILVQTAPTVAETDFLLELAETSSIIGGVVDGWICIFRIFPRNWRSIDDSASSLRFAPCCRTCAKTIGSCGRK